MPNRPPRTMFAATLTEARRRAIAGLLLSAAVLLSGCGGSQQSAEGGSEAAAAGSGDQGAVVIGADGRPITGAIAAPKPASTSAEAGPAPEEVMAAYLRGLDECALADEAVAPPNTKPILIDRGGRYDEVEFKVGQSSVNSKHSNSLGSDLWTYPSAAGAQAALATLRAAVADEPGVTIGRVDRVLYATRGDRVEAALTACTERGKAAAASKSSPGEVDRLTAAEEGFVRGPVSDLSGWCYQDSLPTGVPGSVREAKRTAERLVDLVRVKPDAQTSGGDSVRESVAEVIEGLDGYDGCEVSGLADELKAALR